MVIKEEIVADLRLRARWCFLLLTLVWHMPGLA
ncbi:hypothetical protein SEEHRA23_18720 [Salmonella enterica subsp. enterica serovar Heidelberg str. SARA33]|nr:hypothetical protein SEEHRA23_18720 [Salmonella enterica subsp. enterica serovar Heidelberg str. SARA33]